MRNKGLVCILLLVLTKSSGFGQGVVESSPVEVVDLGQVVQHDLGVSGAKPVRVAQNAGAWVVLMKAPPEQDALDHSIVVTGDPASKHALMLDGRFDQVALDQNRHLHLRYIRRGADGNHVLTKFIELDFTGKKVNAGTVPEIYADLLLAGGNARWMTGHGLLDPRAQSIQSPKIEDPNGKIGQRVFHLGLSGGNYISLGDLSEQISFFDANNSMIFAHPVDLDSAYRLIGLRVPAHSDAVTGMTRVGWAATTASGLLCIYLSNTPASGPAYVALFDPATGSLKSAIKANLPRAEGRRQMPFNPQGTMSAGLGAFGDRLIIMDPEMGIVALY
jgi:hypothetical protein